MAVEVLSLGCRLNLAESETIRGLAAGQDELVVVNSCAVTNEAVRQTRQAIRQARRRRPDARILVTGCAAEIDPESFRAMPEVAALIPQSAKLAPASYPARPRIAAEPAPARHARAFIPVQTGCDHHCTFCIIPQGRGASRSLPAGAVIDSVAAALDAGHREIVLTGVDVTSYGADLPGRPTLGLLVERILARVAVPRLRLSSIDGAEVDGRLFELLTQEARVMPHVHLSLQAGDDLILKRMRRRHSRADAVRLAQRLMAARPEIAIGADLIAGFPTEDAAMFANSLKLIDDCAIVHAHIFPYSARTGTPAARMPQVDGATVRARAAALRARAAERRAEWLRGLVGSRAEMLVERPGDRGHSPAFAEIRLTSGCAPVGTIVPVRVTALAEGRLIGESAA